MQKKMSAEVTAHGWFETFARAYAAELGYVFYCPAILRICSLWGMSS